MAKSSGEKSGRTEPASNAPIVTVVPPIPSVAPRGLSVEPMPTVLASLRAMGLFFVQRVSEGMTLCLLLLSAVLAIASIAEISSRQQARAEVDMLEREETALLMSQISSPPMPLGAAQDTDMKSGAVLLAAQEARNHSTQRHLLGVAWIHGYAMESRSQIDSLSVRGAGASRKGAALILEEMRSNVRKVRARLTFPDGMDPQSGASAQPPPGPEGTAALPEPPWVESLGRQLQNFWAQIPLEHARTDYLLALVVACCALVGAIIAMLREGGARFATKQVVLGLASGFVAFLSLRGGRSVFMMELSGDVPHFNPYSMAFAGLLVGLFTRKAYELLGILVQELDGRLRAAMQGPPVARATPPNEPKQNPEP
ncbi:hypothetical protein [Corallococcus sp. CA047B]|uniref:hypothetical protein n=1 Tax=Corallococcus sp. CA047B TaxID=2316729 RepID=UPI0011C3EC09|nr:hypothetical protein [Corallococcus sp. CA047B]